jgi:filamentous hemagglutinin
MQYLMDHAAQAQQSLGPQFASPDGGTDSGAEQQYSVVEATTINGQTVMVPKYLSPNDVTVNNGSVIAGNQVNIRGGNVANNGSTLMAKNGLSVTSEGKSATSTAGLSAPVVRCSSVRWATLTTSVSTISGKQVALESINGEYQQHYAGQ